MIKYKIEYPVKSSTRILYDCLTDPSRITEWFCDSVNLINQGKIYEFFWDGFGQRAAVLSKKENTYIRFKWEEESEDQFFEFRIQEDEITGDIALVITDFAEDEDEVEEAKMLWDSQVKDLFHALGA